MGHLSTDNCELLSKDFIDPVYLREMQLCKLQAIVRHAYDNVALFRSRMDKLKLKPCDIKNLKDIAKLPFMKKTDLRDTYPFGLFAVPQSEIVRLHASSGTTGKPIVVAYTHDDIEVWNEVMYRGLAGAGLSKSDIIQVSYGYDFSPADSVHITVQKNSGQLLFRQAEATQDVR